ncbi:Rossmann-fold NAD(P)-binding domain-containing protein [Spirosoma pollinicola]|uniref:Uncharacterized protein n=1 Tax=Spirosoma pollinicola TaxID=2057025 RepID=A0A2K8YTD6_9BACT|nr:hypothetical protein [Spirosoma pollinicola]AUD00838.1 hypothetical protein CWM47_02800 [Spirosoma pollinicola]
MGPENVTPREVAVLLSNALGHPIRYERLALETVNDQLRSAGFTETVQQELLDLFVALSDPNGAYATPRTPEAPYPVRRFRADKIGSVVSRCRVVEQ